MLITLVHREFFVKLIEFQTISGQIEGENKENTIHQAFQYVQL